MEMKICIGIVSYIPSSNSNDRKNSIQKLVNQINTIFDGIPIMFITQNWKDFNIHSKNKVIRYDYDKPLGITPARIELRRRFLESEYDYLIMLDDDSDLVGSGTDYIREIKLHPDGFGWFSNHLLKLFAISKYVYSNVEMPNISAEKVEGFEDKIFISMCRIKYPDREFEFDRSKLDEVSYCSPTGPKSTWWNSYTASHIKDLTIRTDKYIKEYADKLGVKFNVPVGKLPDDELQRKKVQPVDIVITYVNNHDNDWLNLFKEYKEKEKVVESDQTTAPQRYRDPGTLKYLFRSIESNCTWVNKVFLVVQNKNQLPDWLNLKCSKLRVVYHDEFIPKEFLPTFNTNVIHMNLCKIKDLSDNYILCNDDMFFTGKIEREEFFKGNIPCQYIRKDKYPKWYDTFNCMIKNNYNLLDSIFPGRNNYYYHTHTQSARNKYIERYILEKYKDLIYKGLSTSHFRTKDNYTDWLYDDYLKSSELCYHNENLLTYSKQYGLNSSNAYDNNIKLMCINDNGKVDNYNVAVNNLIFFLSTKFPNKCSFELNSSSEGVVGKKIDAINVINNNKLINNQSWF